MRTFIILLLIFNLTSCNYENSFIKKLSENYRDHYIIISIPIINDTDTSEVCVTNTELYKYIYSDRFSNQYSNYYQFLQLLIEGKLILDEKKYPIRKIYRVNNNSQLRSEYDSGGLNLIMSKYLINKENKLANSSKLKWEDRGILVKVMLNEKFYPIEDDYSGEIWFFKSFDE